ncbi:MAG: heavy metal translocating P-type ATPase [Candidatus Hodarchaeota archaeon]
MKTARLKIKGLDCASCGAPLEKYLSQQRGIGEIKLSYTKQEAMITFNELETSEETLKKEIRDRGFSILESETINKTSFSSIFLFSFVSVIAILLIMEIIIERLSIFEGVFEAIPPIIPIFATLVGGYPIFRGAFQGLRLKQINADLLMTVAIFGAMILSEFAASTLIVFFMTIAHFLERFTLEKSRKAIKDIIDHSPKTAVVKRGNEEIRISVEEINIGDVVISKPGEQIPVDGTVIFGSSSVDQASITGESIPVVKTLNDEVYAGTINQHGVLHIKTDKIGENTTLGRIIKLVEDAESSKASIQKFADKYSTYFLPIVILASLITFAITLNPFSSIAVLVVACPCAVALATPIAVVASAGSSAKKGIVVKGGLYLEALAKVDTVVVDKTGTLTYGKPQVTDIISFNSSENEILKLAASVERYSEHPLASAVVEKTKDNNIQLLKPEYFEYVVGRGIFGRIQTNMIIVGNEQLLTQQKIDLPSSVKKAKEDLEKLGKSVIHVAKDDEIIGLIATSDVVRQEVYSALQEIRNLGIERIILLTGDNERIAKSTADYLDIDQYEANLLPQDKINYIKQLQSNDQKVLMIGDGVNDAPALAQADVGIAMGSGTDVAIETSNVVLMQDDWRQIPKAIKIGRKTFSTIKQNIVFGILFNIAGISLASAGILTPILAAMAQSLPDVLVFLNSSRLLRS